VRSTKLDEDPRSYVRWLKQLALERRIAPADASALWCRLWRQGSPYITLPADSTNQPDARGHELLADALVAVFSEE